MYANVFMLITDYANLSAVIYYNKNNNLLYITTRE